MAELELILSIYTFTPFDFWHFYCCLSRMTEQRITDHLANERTFLAWVRTGVAIMAFGFVVVKFSLFVRQIALVINRDMGLPPKGYSAFIGITLVAFGVIINLLAYFRYKRVERQIDSGTFGHSSLFLSALVVSLSLAGLAVVFYLIHSI